MTLGSFGKVYRSPVLRRYLPLAVFFTAAFSGVAAWIASEPVDETAGWRINRVAMSESGRWVAAGSASGWIGIIDQTAPEAPQRFRAGAGELRDLRFSADEKWLIVENDALARHAVQSLGSLEPLGPGDDRGEAQIEGMVVPQGIRTSNVAGGSSGVAVFGNAKGVIEVRDPKSGRTLRRFTFR